MSEIQGNTVCYMWLRFNMDQQFEDTAIKSIFQKRKIFNLVVGGALTYVWF